MNTRMETRFGHLSVTVDSVSRHLRDHAPIEIRDSKMRLVDHQGGNHDFDLLPGFYQVSAVLEDGLEHTGLVEIKQDQDAKIKLPAPQELDVDDEEEISGTFKILNLPRKRSNEQPRYSQKFASTQETRPDAGGFLDAEVLSVAGASLVRQTHKVWIFECKKNGSAVPTATMRLGKRKSVVSLPTSQPSDIGPITCAVRVDNSPTGPRATAWISPERVVANAFMNMLASGQLRHAVDMAGGAADLVRQKYRDPTGAMLGALILHKVDQLDDYEPWIENMVRDFSWIPDGKILLASLLVKRQEDRDRAWQLLQEASEQRILYTESYSILLGLLRRWPREDESVARQEIIAELAWHSPYIDWDSICLSRVVPG